MSPASSAPPKRSVRGWKRTIVRPLNCWSASIASTQEIAATYREALDEALCFGWIDGVRKRYQPGSYSIRFSPRKPGSIWSLLNTRRMEQLIKDGRVQEFGLSVFERRDKKKSKLYSYERDQCKFETAHEKQFRANAAAWGFYQAQAPWYRRVSCCSVTSAKKEETRLRRLATLIDDSAQGRRIKQLISNPVKPA